jgi:hypothetical protein
MQNILTVREVLERIEKADWLEEYQRIHSPVLRAVHPIHRPEFYIPKLTRGLLPLEPIK